jgi:hypothetical protein
MNHGHSLFCFAFLFAGCATTEVRQLLPGSETVMTPGMRVTATNQNGTVTITAGEGTRRHYAGTGWKKSLALIARSERWDGSLGLYDPASSFSPYGRVLAEEGRIHCTSVSEAMRWLYVGSALNHPTYTNNGLVFCYSVAVPPGNAGEPCRAVELWQLYINGRRPQHLPGANDRAIRVEGGSIPNTSTAHRASVGYDMLLGDHEYVAH